MNDITADSLQIARLDERMISLTRDLEDVKEQLGDMRVQLEAVLAKLNEARGGWRTLMWLGGAAAAAGGAVSWVVSHIKFSP